MRWPPWGLSRYGLGRRTPPFLGSWPRWPPITRIWSISIGPTVLSGRRRLPSWPPPFPGTPCRRSRAGCGSGPWRNIWSTFRIPHSLLRCPQSALRTPGAWRSELAPPSSATGLWGGNCGGCQPPTPASARGYCYGDCCFWPTIWHPPMRRPWSSCATRSGRPCFRVAVTRIRRPCLPYRVRRS